MDLHWSSDSTVASGGLNSSAAEFESSLVDDFFDELVEETSGVEISVAKIRFTEDIKKK